MMYTLFQTTVTGTDDALPVTHLYGLIIVNYWFLYMDTSSTIIKQKSFVVCAFYTTPDNDVAENGV